MMKTSSPFAVLNMGSTPPGERPARRARVQPSGYERLLSPSPYEVFMGSAQGWGRGPTTAGGPQPDMKKFSLRGRARTRCTRVADSSIWHDLRWKGLIPSDKALRMPERVWLSDYTGDWNVSRSLSEALDCCRRSLKKRVRRVRAPPAHVRSPDNAEPFSVPAPRLDEEARNIALLQGSDGRRRQGRAMRSRFNSVFATMSDVARPPRPGASSGP